MGSWVEDWALEAPGVVLDPLLLGKCLGVVPRSL